MDMADMESSALVVNLNLPSLCWLVKEVTGLSVPHHRISILSSD